MDISTVLGAVGFIGIFILFAAMAFKTSNGSRADRGRYQNHSQIQTTDNHHRSPLYWGLRGVGSSLNNRSRRRR